MAIKVTDTESGNPYHDEASGEFTTKDGGSVKEGEEDSSFLDMLSPEDEDSLSDILGLDDDYDDDDSEFDFLKEEDAKASLEEIASKSCTLRNYAKTRAKKLKEFTRDLSTEDAMFLRDKMKEILSNTSFASRIQVKNFKTLIKSGYYKNQFGVGHSEGYYEGTGYSGGRTKMTRADFGTEEEDKAKWEKYGILYPTGDYKGLIDGDDNAKYHYGHIACLWNKDKCRGRVTYTLDDSLDYSEITPIRVEDDADEFISDHGYRLTKENLEDAETIFDVREACCGSYVEAQYHFDEMPLEDLLDAVVIPYSDLSEWGDDLKSTLKLMNEKYPNVKILSQTGEGRIKVVTIGDDDEYKYSFEEFNEKL